MRTARALITISCLLPLLVACVTVEPNSSTKSRPQPSTLSQETVGQGNSGAMRRAAVVTTGIAKLNPAKPSTIAWGGKIEISGKHPILSRRDVSLQVESSLMNEIARKGYELRPDQSDFQLQARVILPGGEIGGPFWQGNGGIDPGLATSSSRNQRGTLLLILKQGRLVRWRGTVQIYLAAQLAPDVASQRIDYAVKQLLRTWP